MKQTRLIMGMPITIEIADPEAAAEDLEKVFGYFEYVDERFSPFKPDSEVSRINRGEIKPGQYSEEMREVLALSEQTKKETAGYFDIFFRGKCDPSGLVKGWAINNAANLMKRMGYENFYVEAGGDIALCGWNEKGQPWAVGIRNPFKPSEIIKVIRGSDIGVATSGIYERGEHIYNPNDPDHKPEDIASLTVIGKNIYEADRMATAAFAMDMQGIKFIQNLPGFEGYAINNQGVATLTTGFNNYVSK